MEREEPRAQQLKYCDPFMIFLLLKLSYSSVSYFREFGVKLLILVMNLVKLPADLVISIWSWCKSLSVCFDDEGLANTVLVMETSRWSPFIGLALCILIYPIGFGDKIINLVRNLLFYLNGC